MTFLVTWPVNIDHLSLMKSFTPVLNTMSSNSVSALSLTDITTQSFVSLLKSAAYRISISPTNRYSGDRADLNRSFRTAFPLIVHRDHERRTLTVIEEPNFPIIRAWRIIMRLMSPAFDLILKGSVDIPWCCVCCSGPMGGWSVVPDKCLERLGKDFALRGHWATLPSILFLRMF